MDLMQVSQEGPVLPLDVFEYIVDNVSNLGSLGLVCRLFAHLCRKKRFSDVKVVHLPHGFDISRLRGIGNSSHRCSRLTSLLKQQPDLTKFIRHLHCRGWETKGRLFREVFNLNLLQLSLSEFSYRPSTRNAKFGPGRLLDHYVSAGNISSLALVAVHRVPILTILSCPSITELTIRHCTYSDDWRTDPNAIGRLIQLGIKVQKLVLAEGRAVDPGSLFNHLYPYFSALEKIDASFTVSDPMVFPSNPQLNVAAEELLNCLALRMPPKGLTKLHSITSRSWVDWSILCQLASKFGIEAFPSLKTAQFCIGDSSNKYPLRRNDYTFTPSKGSYQSCFNAVFENVKTLENLDISIKGEKDHFIDLHGCMVRNSHSLKTMSIYWENPEHVFSDRILDSVCAGLEEVQGNNVLRNLSLIVNISLKGTMLPQDYFNSWDTLDEILLRNYQEMFPCLREVNVQLKFTSPSAQIFLDSHQDSNGEPTFFKYRFERMIDVASRHDTPIKCKVSVYGLNGQQVVGVSNIG